MPTSEKRPHTIDQTLPVHAPTRTARQAASRWIRAKIVIDDVNVPERPRVERGSVSPIY